MLYIYIQRGSERERERDYIYIYIYIHIWVSPPVLFITFSPIFKCIKIKAQILKLSLNSWKCFKISTTSHKLENVTGFILIVLLGNKNKKCKNPLQKVDIKICLT